jgi:hypothetical protein
MPLTPKASNKVSFDTFIGDLVKCRRNSRNAELYTKYQGGLQWLVILYGVSSSRRLLG